MEENRGIIVWTPYYGGIQDIVWRNIGYSMEEYRIQYGGIQDTVWRSLACSVYCAFTMKKTVFSGEYL